MENVGARVIRSKMQKFLTGSCNFAWLLVGYSLVTLNVAFHEVPN